MRKLCLVTHLCAASVLILSVLSCDSVMPKRSPGEKLFRKHCTSCHGINAEGHTVKYMGNENADLLDDSWEYGGDPHSLEDVIESNRVTQHPSYDKLSSQQVRQIVDHLLYLRGETR